jgi:hypothetical protein
MRYLVSVGLLAFAASAHAQQDCTPQRPCAVTTDIQTGRTTTTPASPAGTRAPAIPANKDVDHPGNFYRHWDGPEVLSLEEAANSYFEHVARRDASYPGSGEPFDPKNVMWDRGELTDAEAAEVLEVARRQHLSGMPQGVSNSGQRRASHRRLCEELARAGTADAKVTAFEEAEERTTTQEKAAGKAILDQLSPSTRASVLKVIAEHRKDISVGRPDWQKMRASQPEALDKHHKSACVGVN